MTHYCHNSPDLSSCYHFLIGGSWLTSPGPLLSIVMTRQRTEVTFCRTVLQHRDSLQPLVRSWLTADRGWRLLRDSGQSAGWSLPESFPSLKIFRNCNDFFRTKWLIDEVQKPLIIVPVIDSNYYFVTRDRWIIRHCQCPLRPGFWLSAAWLSFNGHSLGLDASPEWTKCWHQGQSGAVSHTAIWIITAADSAEFRSNYLHILRRLQNWNELNLLYCISFYHWSLL